MERENSAKNKVLTGALTVATGAIMAATATDFSELASTPFFESLLNEVGHVAGWGGIAFGTTFAISGGMQSEEIEDES